MFTYKRKLKIKRAMWYIPSLLVSWRWLVLGEVITIVDIKIKRLKEKDIKISIWRNLELQGEWQAGLDYRHVCHSKLHLCWVNLNLKLSELQGQKPGKPHKPILWALWGIRGPQSDFWGRDRLCWILRGFSCGFLYVTKYIHPGMI